MNLNLADFKAEYKLNKALQSLTNLIAGAQQPNGQPIFPNEPGTPLNDIIRQYNLQPAEAPPPYDFGLDNHVTIEAIKAECIQRNVNFFDVTNTPGNRQFYDITYGAAPPVDRNRITIRGENTPDLRQQRDLWNNGSGSGSGPWIFMSSPLMPLW